VTDDAELEKLDKRDQAAPVKNDEVPRHPDDPPASEPEDDDDQGGNP
jgi:hypothetical protein